MDYRILGPLEVVDENGTIPLGGPRQRSIFAICSCTRTGSSPDTADDLYVGRRAPPTAAKRSSRSRSGVYARRSAGTPVDPRARLRPPGRRRRARPRAVRAPVGEARTRRAGDTAAAAAARGARALARRRRSPTSPTSRSPARRSSGSRSCASPRSRSGSTPSSRSAAHAELVGELEALVAEHPLRERLRGQLMLALYRSGGRPTRWRRTAARAWRSSTSFGIEPGAALQQLERQILAHDRRCSCAACARAPSPAPQFLSSRRSTGSALAPCRSRRSSPPPDLRERADRRRSWRRRVASAAALSQPRLSRDRDLSATRQLPSRPPTPADGRRPARRRNRSAASAVDERRVVAARGRRSSTVLERLPCDVALCSRPAEPARDGTRASCRSAGRARLGRARARRLVRAGDRLAAAAGRHAAPIRERPPRREPPARRRVATCSASAASRRSRAGQRRGGGRARSPRRRPRRRRLLAALAAEGLGKPAGDRHRRPPRVFVQRGLRPGGLAPPTPARGSAGRSPRRPRDERLRRAQGRARSADGRSR